MSNTDTTMQQQEEHDQQEQQQSHRGVRFSSEQAAAPTTAIHYFEQDLTEAEIASIWYNQADFKQMKSDMKRVMQRQQKRRQRQFKQQEKTTTDMDDDDTERGLEKLLPSSRAVMQQHKRETIRAIVTMYHELYDHVAKEEEEDPDEVLRQFSLHKTSYAQHTANYRAAMDAAAVYGQQRYSSSSMSGIPASPLSLSSRQQPNSSSMRSKQQQPRPPTTRPSSPKGMPQLAAPSPTMKNSKAQPRTKLMQPRRVPISAPTA